MIHKSKNNLYISYIRVSTKKQEKGMSLEIQRQINNSFIESVNGRLLKEFEAAESAYVEKRMKGKIRKDFEAMIELAKETGAAIVVAYDDRFARDVEIVAKALNEGIRIIDALNPHRTRESFLQSAIANELVSQRISDKTRPAMALKKLKGEPLGANTHKVKQDMKKMRVQRMRLVAWEFLSSEKAVLFAELLKEYDKRFEEAGTFDFDKVKVEKKNTKLFDDKLMNKLLRQINKFHLKTFEPETKNPVQWDRKKFMLFLKSYCLHCKTYRFFFGRISVEEAEKMLDFHHFTDEQYNKWLKNSAIQNRIAANKEKQKQRLEQEAKYIRELGYIPPRKETRGRPRKVVNE